MTCADILARTLRDAGVSRMFGLPGGEILQFIEAARAVGIRFVLTRHEAHAAFMADATGQVTGTPGVCVSTLGPGAVNMTLGVANAFLDRSPVVAITAAHPRAAAPYATHQQLDLAAVYRPFTKLSMTLDGRDTARKIQHAVETSRAPRRGPVHIALPSDVAAAEECVTHTWTSSVGPGASARPAPDALERVHGLIRASRRPVVVLGLDLQPAHAPEIQAFVDALGAPVFVTPKAKGILPDDHPLYCGVCAGVSADAEIMTFFHRSDLLVGVGFDPVESDKLWHTVMRLVAIGPVSAAAREYRPYAECLGDVAEVLSGLRDLGFGASDWTQPDFMEVRAAITRALTPAQPPRGLSGSQLTRHLRDRFPDETIFVTDVGSVKMVTAQAWRAPQPGRFLVSNGLSAMGYSLPAAIAARLANPASPVLCAVGDGGFAMTLGEVETCVREGVDLTIVVFNDDSLSLIDIAQQRQGYPPVGVRFAPVDYAAAARALGAWARRVDSLDAVDAALRDAPAAGPVVLEAVVDPAEYLHQMAGHRQVSGPAVPR